MFPFEFSFISSSSRENPVRPNSLGDGKGKPSRNPLGDGSGCEKRIGEDSHLQVGGSASRLLGDLETEVDPTETALASFLKLLTSEKSHTSSLDRCRNFFCLVSLG